MIEYKKRITRMDLQRERGKLFVFGDNIERRGLGGQAAAMRGEFNAVGIPTKWEPTMNPEAFFINGDVYEFMQSAASDFRRLIIHSKMGVVVWPQDGIGTGRAQLKQRAPLIWAIIEALRKELEE